MNLIAILNIWLKNLVGNSLNLVLVEGRSNYCGLFCCWGHVIAHAIFLKMELRFSRFISKDKHEIDHVFKCDNLSLYLLTSITYNP